MNHVLGSMHRDQSLLAGLVLIAAETPAARAAKFRTSPDLTSPPPRLDPIFLAPDASVLESFDARTSVTKWAADSRVRRFTDLAVDALLAPLTLPVLAGGAIALAREGQVGKIRFDSYREGMDGEMFAMHKLRTLLGGDQSDSSQGAEDERATAVGAFLRRYIIDELLVLPTNVVKGQMQLVAHRPLVDDDFALMKAKLRSEDYRIWRDVYGAEPPGFLSAFGNFSAFLDPESDDYLRARAALDVWQALNAGPGLTRRIIFDTIRIGLGKVRDPSELAGFNETQGGRVFGLAA
ncbi:sugar transferase [Trinickia sp. LjRoot230]|uniref:sugar transferase n=1 Tax=Trinickia sp. LjRoot230 TaxID=3342288 RepID=UPI003ECD9E7E